MSDVLQVLLDLTRTILHSQPNSQRLHFSASTLQELQRASPRQRDLLEASGKLHLGLAASILFRNYIPSVVSQPVVERVISESLEILTSNGTDVRFYQSIGVLSGCIHGHDTVYKFLLNGLNESLLVKLALATVPFPESVGPDVEPAGRLHKLLLRLKEFTDEQTARPALMPADLRPIIVPTGVAPSKLSTHAPSPFPRMVVDAKGDPFAYLQSVADAEILSDGWFPSVLPELSTWAILDSIRERRVVASMQDQVLDAFISDLIVSKSGLVDVAFHDAILGAAVSRRTLLLLLFRMGVYQSIPECPFDGLDAEYPASALRLYFAAMHRDSHYRVQRVVSNVFQTLLDVLCNAWSFWLAHASRHEAAINPVDRPALPKPRQRQALADLTVNGGNPGGCTWAQLQASQLTEAQMSPRTRRKVGRTVVPLVKSIGMSPRTYFKVVLRHGLSGRRRIRDSDIENE
ncbi:hypothetical protein DFH07DRAFT_798610 [Mycena maculata]|uniref:Uncharacterized protein n=1 Tax=Mycena maculata TaxID=230809 RepID=A0AAD7NV94_9AGAR|nr:hypothetical protein DFH07DRAFT_798610 [Mycena maculata]